MGGAVCRILVNARLTFNTVPTEVDLLKIFDAQMKDIHGITEYAQSIVNDTDDWPEVCAILGKQIPHWSAAQWSHADRQKLLDVKDEICGPYVPAVAPP
jgi:hypothetical protein